MSLQRCLEIAALAGAMPVPRKPPMLYRRIPVERLPAYAVEGWELAARDPVPYALDGQAVLVERPVRWRDRLKRLLVGHA